MREGNIFSPFTRESWGIPHPAGGGEAGTLIQPTGGGESHAADGGTTARSGWGAPGTGWGNSTPVGTGWGTLIRTEFGYPLLKLDGVPPCRTGWSIPWKTEQHSKYLLCRMPLAFMQKNFLVVCEIRERWGGGHLGLKKVFTYNYHTQ